MKAEKYALSADSGVSKSLVEVIQDINADEKIQATSLWDESRKFGNGPLQKAEEAMLHHATQWKVTPENLEEKMAEIMNGAGKSFHRLLLKRNPTILSL